MELGSLTGQRTPVSNESCAGGIGDHTRIAATAACSGGTKRTIR
jgi:hypothetical protein